MVSCWASPCTVPTTSLHYSKEDIEDDIVLPPLEHQITRLDMDPYQTITYNSIQSIIAMNAVDSQRTDKDYFFHTSNHRYLKQLVENLSQVCFWFMDRVEWDEDLDNTVLRSQNALFTALSRNATDEDVDLVRQANRVL